MDDSASAHWRYYSNAKRPILWTAMAATRQKLCTKALDAQVLMVIFSGPFFAAPSAIDANTFVAHTVLVKCCILFGIVIPKLQFVSTYMRMEVRGEPNRRIVFVITFAFCYCVSSFFSSILLRACVCVHMHVSSFWCINFCCWIQASPSSVIVVFCFFFFFCALCVSAHCISAGRRDPWKWLLFVSAPTVWLIRLEFVSFHGICIRHRHAICSTIWLNLL